MVWDEGPMLEIGEHEVVYVSLPRSWKEDHRIRIPRMELTMEEAFTLAVYLFEQVQCWDGLPENK